MKSGGEARALRALKGTTFDTYWLDSLGSVADEAVLEQDLDCDLLVVGGGFCGLWAAIMSTSVMHGIDNTERIFPEDVAEPERLGRENMDAFRETVERYRIDCDIEWSGEMTVSIGDQGIATVDEDHELYLKYGHDAVKLDKAGIQSEIKSPIFHAGTWSRKRGGTLHPGKLVRGLKRAALELGVRLLKGYSPVE